MIQKAKTDRLAHLEAQALDALTLAADNFEKAVFPNAMIVGDCVITHLLGKLGYLESGKVKIMVVDTFHLFDSTMPFLDELEKKYKFKAEIFGPADCADKDVYLQKYGDKLWVADVEQYDKICKVEPFQRGLKTLETDVMINGRRRDHGAERAYIDIAEVAPIGGGLAKLNLLAYWTLEDCFDYAAANGVPLHPTVALGYPSQGDEKDTVLSVPDPDGLSGFKGDAGSVKFVNGKWTGDKSIWLDYGNERKGRFVGLVNKDGSTKTECGIHVAGAEKTFDRDLWESGKSKVLELGEGRRARAQERLGQADRAGHLRAVVPVLPGHGGRVREARREARRRRDGREVPRRRGPRVRLVRVRRRVVPDDQRHHQGRQGHEVRVRGARRRLARQVRRGLRVEGPRGESARARP